MNDIAAGRLRWCDEIHHSSFLIHHFHRACVSTQSPYNVDPGAFAPGINNSLLRTVVSEPKAMRRTHAFV